MTSKLGIYIHIPFCNGKCAYCDFVSGVYSGETQRAYFSALSAEISRFDFSPYCVDTVYIGGGTPSSVDPAHIAGILELIPVIRGAEVSIECNPESFTAEKAAAYAGSGINRISFGLQTSNDRLLKKLGRLHTSADFIKAAAAAQRYFGNISADLMLGLPGQDAKDVIDAVEFVDPYVSHVSVYALKVEEGTPLASSGYAPDEDVSADLYGEANEALAARGFERYEVSNFARQGRICRHNYKYWTLEEYKGFGVAAHSYFSCRREENTPLLHEYVSGKTVDVTHEIQRGGAEDMEEFVMLALRTAGGIDLDKFAQRFGYRLENAKAKEIKKLEQYINIDKNKISIRNNGLYLMNKIIVELI